MITKEKLNKLHVLSEELVKTAENERIRNAGTIIQLLVRHVDDLLEEVLWLKEENESMRFDLEDKKIEHRRTNNRMGRSNRTATNNGTGVDNLNWGLVDDDTPF